MSPFPQPRRAALVLMAGLGVSAAIPARAQIAAPAAESEQRPATLGSDQTSIGGQPLTDASPRLPRVDYGDIDLTVPVAPDAGLLRGQTVLGRGRPAYDPVGINVAGFRVLPDLTVRASYDSNVFSQADGRGDVFGHLRGAILARSDWGRNEAVFDGFVDERAYASYGSESGITYNARAAGRYDLDRASSVSGSVQHGRVFIERGATTEVLQTRRPVRYEFTSSDLSARTQQGRFTLDLAGKLSRYDYANSDTPAGAFVDQRFRNFLLYRVEGAVGYATGAGPALFVTLAAEARRFDNNDVRIRDSDGLEALVGVRGDLTPLLRGRLDVGFLRYDFKDPAIRTRAGLGLDVSLDYLVTPLTTISVSARRELKNVSSVTLPAAFAISAAAGVDHELLRNLVVSVGATFEDANYVASPLQVKRYGGHAGGFFLLDRHIRLDADLAYRRRDENSTTRQRDFSEINATTGMTYRF